MQQYPIRMGLAVTTHPDAVFLFAFDIRGIVPFEPSAGWRTAFSWWEEGVYRNIELEMLRPVWNATSKEFNGAFKPVVVDNILFARNVQVDALGTYQQGLIGALEEAGFQIEELTTNVWE